MSRHKLSPDPTKDLLIIVKQREQAGRPALVFQVSGFHLNHKKFGPHPILRDPQFYFHRFFKELESQSNLLGWGRTGPEDYRQLNEQGLNLFQEVFPIPLQEELWLLRDRVQSLQILSEESWIPWECCKLQGMERGQIKEGLFFCEAFRMARWVPEIELQRDLPLRRIAVFAKNAMLPKVRDEMGFMLGLAGANREVHKFRAESEPLRKAMRSARFDGWHFAGHMGSAQSKTILELEDDQAFSPENITGSNRNMGVTRPLVFFNSCYSGRSKLALTGVRGWAQKFIENGAGAFIGTLWAVEDKAAYRFARAFYTYFLAGAPLGEAVRQARMEIKKLGDASWLAFTLFGHPLAYSGPVDATDQNNEPAPPIQDFWRATLNRAPETWAEITLPVLSMLAVAKEPIHADVLAAFAGVSEAQTRQVLSDWQAWIEAHRIVGADQNGEDRYALKPNLRKYIEQKDGVDQVDLARSRFRLTRSLYVHVLERKPD